MTVRDPPAEEKEEKEEEKKTENKETKFRNLIINKCQKEFERDNAKDKKLQELKLELDKSSVSIIDIIMN